MLLFTNCTIEYLFVKQCQLGMGQYRFFRHRHDIDICERDCDDVIRKCRRY